ncbi:hypothetical protein M5689_019144 [Euphorbia peplus]|nr:hypothetical protein M5689_019144 [Euphorbia peplus]
MTCLYEGPVAKHGDQYAKMALEYYEKNNSQGIREWCHLSFTAEPINADDSTKRFFGELVLDHAVSGIDRVTHCSIFDPTEPGLTYGCEFCPTSPLCLHPPDGYLIGDLSCIKYSNSCPASDLYKREHSVVGTSHEQRVGDLESHQVKHKSGKHVSSEQSGVDLSHEPMGGELESQQVKSQSGNPVRVQRRPGSSDGQMGKSSKHQPKRKRVKNDNVSGVQAGIDSSLGQMREGSKCKRLEKKHLSGHEGVVGKNGVTYAKMALEYYQKSVCQDVKLELGKVLFSVCGRLVVPGYKGVRQWCHLNFTAEPINAIDRCDDSPKRFFGELVLDHAASGIHRVTHCSMFDPTEPGLTYGCAFCPSASLCLHPPDGYLTGDLSCVAGRGAGVCKKWAVCLAITALNRAAVGIEAGHRDYVGYILSMKFKSYCL